MNVAAGQVQLQVVLDEIRAFSVVTAWTSSGTWWLAVSVTVGRPLASVSNCTVAHAVERERLAPPEPKSGARRSAKQSDRRRGCPERAAARWSTVTASAPQPVGAWTFQDNVTSCPGLTTAGETDRLPVASVRQ